MTLVNDVLFAGSMTGFLYGMDASTGEILFSYDTGGSYNTAPTAWDSYLVTGSGYARFGLGPGQSNFYVFKLGGNSTASFPSGGHSH